MSQKFYPEQVKQLLNRSAAQIDQPTVDRLRGARMQALARYDAHSMAPAFVWAGWASHRHAADAHHKSHHWAAIVVIVAILFSCTVYWQHVNDRDVSDVDVEILTDDLPVEMYVD